MGSPTAIEVTTDLTEYSRYESGRNRITVSLAITGGAPYSAEEVIVDLVKARRSRDAVVATETVSFTASTDPQEAVVEFYLPDLVDQDLIHLARHGLYFVRATSVTDDSIIGESADFRISVVSVERLKSDYLFGIDLSATEIKEPRFQPQNVSGIEVVELSKTHPIGAATLNYLYHTDNTANAAASIGSGANGTVNITCEGSLLGTTGNSVVVNVTVPSGTSGLSASYNSSTKVLTVALAVSAGVPVTLSNTATLVAAAIAALPDFTATASGTGGDSLATASGPTQFAGGATTVIRQANWNGGPLVSINRAGTFILMSGNSGPAAGLSLTGAIQNFAVIRVRSTLLTPTENVSEVLLIDKKRIDDETLARLLDQSIAWVEKDFLATPIEPTNAVTDRDPTTVQYSAGVNAPAPIFTDTDYDLLVSPLTHFNNNPSGAWINIQFPWPQLLRVDSMFGAISNTRVIDIDLEWIQISQQGGLVQLVPFAQEIALNFVGLLWANALQGAAEVPNFWHYNAIVGLREASADVQELVAKKAAIDALTIAGLALRPGVGSVSLGRDGVSESVSYTTSAKYGPYTGVIQSYKDWIDERGKELRAKYRGITMVVV